MRKEQEDAAWKEQAIHTIATDEICPSCGEELALSTASESGCVEIECVCGCTLAAA